MDKIPAAVVILVGSLVVSIIAGWNNNLGKFLFVFMLIFALLWLIGGGTQGDLAKWFKLGGFPSTTKSTSGIFPTPTGNPAPNITGSTGQG